METEILTKYEEVQNALAAVDDVLESISFLDNISSAGELHETMPRLLASLGHYSLSDRAYIFSWVSEERTELHMVHEWCAEGVRPTMDEMQHVRMEDMPHWAFSLYNGDPIVSMDWDAQRVNSPEESAPDFTYRLSAAYLKEHDRFAYRFRTYPNPAGMQYFEVQIVRLTGMDGFKTVMGYRYIDDIIKEQEKQKVQLENALADATLNSEIIDSISKIYWIIYRMDLVNSILDMNKLESGTVVLERRPFDLMEVLRETNSITEMNGVARGL